HVGHLRREDSLSLQYVVDMRLGDSRHLGETALGEFAAADSLPKMFDEPPLQFLEVHFGPISRSYRGLLGGSGPGWEIPDSPIRDVFSLTNSKCLKSFRLRST